MDCRIRTEGCAKTHPFYVFIDSPQMIIVCVSADRLSMLVSYSLADNAEVAEKRLGG